jgi:hypothetical protein
MFFFSQFEGRMLAEFKNWRTSFVPSSKILVLNSFRVQHLKMKKKHSNNSILMAVLCFVYLKWNEETFVENLAYFWLPSYKNHGDLCRKQAFSLRIGYTKFRNSIFGVICKRAIQVPGNVKCSTSPSRKGERRRTKYTTPLHGSKHVPCSYRDYHTPG